MAGWSGAANSIDPTTTPPSFSANLLESAMKSVGLKPTSVLMDHITDTIVSTVKTKCTVDNLWNVVLRSIFKFVDEDSSGNIDCVELRNCLLEVGVAPSLESCRAIIAEYDVDGSGEIELDEFTALMLSKYAAEVPPELGYMVEAKTGGRWAGERNTAHHITAALCTALLIYFNFQQKSQNPENCPSTLLEFRPHPAWKRSEVTLAWTPCLRIYCRRRTTRGRSCSLRA